MEKKAYQDSSEWIWDTHECCVCRRPIREASEHVNLVQLPFKVPWAFPCMGNVLTGQKGRGVAIVCDSCFAIGGKLQIKYCLQYEGGKVIYHDVNELQ